MSSPRQTLQNLTHARNPVASPREHAWAALIVVETACYAHA
jgi:hypothetical protein